MLNIRKLTFLGFSMNIVQSAFTVFQGFRSLGTIQDNKNFFWLMVLLPLTVVLDSLNVVLILPLSQVIFHSSVAPSGFQEFLANVSQQLSVDLNYFVVILFGVCSVTGAIVKVLFFKMQFQWVSQLTGSISALALKQYVEQNYIRYLGRRKSSLADILTHKIYYTASHLLSPTVLLIQSVISTFLILLILLQTNFLMTLICLGSLAIVYLLLIIFMKNKLKKVSEDIRVCSSQSVFIGNSIEGGFRDIKVFRLGEFIFRMFLTNEKKFRRAQGDNLFIAHSPRYFVEAGIFLVGSILLYVALKVDGLQELLPTFALFSFAILRLTPFMQQTFTSIAMLSAGHGTVLDLSKEFNFDLEEQSVLQKPFDDQNQYGEKLTDHILLEAVEFKYPDGANIGPISCRVSKGQILVFFGESGKGKSTCLDMIAGLVEPSAGLISLKNSINDWEKPFLGRCLLLSQQPVLLQGSVRDNITLYDNVKSFDRELFLGVVKDFNVDFIDDEFGILATGNQGQKGLSGGQLQRLCLARIFYCGVEGQPILLDEPTSALDQNNEDLILNAIEKRRKNRLIIISSHSKKLLSISDEQFKF